MKTNANKKVEETKEKQHIYEYQEIYGALAELIPDPTLLLQAFTLNNNTDIIKAIEYWKNKIQRENDSNAVKINNIIKQYENIMLFRLYITQDLHTNSLSLMEQGPVSKVETKPLDIKDPKVIDHPASKGKKKKKETVNEKVGNQVKKKKEKVKVDPSVPLYDTLYPTEAEKLEVFATILPTIEQNLNDKDSKRKISGREFARRTLKMHFKNFGESVHFCNDSQIEKLLNWLNEDIFRSRSPFDVLNGERLSIADIVNEARRLTVEVGLGETELKDALKPYILNVQLKEQVDTSEIINTEEGYSDFFQKSISFLLDEDQHRKEVANFEKENETRDNVKERLYEIHKEHGYKCVFKLAKDLQEWVKQTDKDYSLKSAVAEAAIFVKSKNIDMFNEYAAKRSKETGTGGGEKKETSKDEVKKTSEETSKTDGEKGKTNPVTNKPIFNRLEKQLKYKTKKSELSEFLITIINKHVNPIGNRVDELSNKIEDLTILANKAFLEHGIKDEEGKELSDWTEQDVLQYMAEDVVKYITDDYGILKAKDEEALLQELEYYMETYDIGDQKKRTEAIKEVLLSEIPRTSYMKTVAKKVRKDNLTDLNDLFKKLAERQIEKQKKEIEQKKEKTK